MNKKTRTIIILVSGLTAVGISSFYAGLKYEQNKNSSDGFGNLSAQERQARFGANMAGNLPRGTNQDQGFASGEILSKDNESLTLKLRDGGSKIILFSQTSQITKSTDGATDDLKIGETITINGTANQDGSITAKTIQIRPEIIPIENKQ